MLEVLVALLLCLPLFERLVFGEAFFDFWKLQFGVVQVDSGNDCLSPGHDQIRWKVLYVVHLLRVGVRFAGLRVQEVNCRELVILAGVDDLGDGGKLLALSSVIPHSNDRNYFAIVLLSPLGGLRCESHPPVTPHLGSMIQSALWEEEYDPVHLALHQGLVWALAPNWRTLDDRSIQSEN